MNNRIIDIDAIEDFDSLSEREQIIAYITCFRLELYNRGLHCGPKAIQEKLREENITPVPSTSTIARALRSQYLTNGRTGYYEADNYPSDTQNEEGEMRND